jgi:phosphoribosylformylglycinamidine (FGAM) synthase PurS component
VTSATLSEVENIAREILSNQVIEDVVSITEVSA